MDENDAKELEQLADKLHDAPEFYTDSGIGILCRAVEALLLLEAKKIRAESVEV